MTVEVVAGTRRRFTRAEYHRMVEAGILSPEDRVELIRGEIIQKMTIGPRHAAFAMNLTKLLVLRVGDRAHVSVANSVALSDDSEPEPDFAVLRPRAGVPYRQREPYAEDTLLLVEVADSSLRYDRTTKLRLYAETGIPEYWIVDCTTEAVEVYRNPGPDGYRDVTRVTGTTPLTLQALPEVHITPAEIFA